MKSTIALLGSPPVGVQPTPDTSSVSTTESTTKEPPCVAELRGLVTAHVLCARLTTVASPASSAAGASVDGTTVSVPGIPAITVRAIQSTSTTACAASTGTTTIAYLEVGDQVLISQPTDVAPITTFTVGVVRLVLNEQIPSAGPDKGLTVNAVHITANTIGVGRVDTILASSESDVHNCP